MSGSAHVTIGGSGGMMSTAGLELPYPRISQAQFRDETSRRESNVMFICKLVYLLNMFSEHGRYNRQHKSPLVMS